MPEHTHTTHTATAGDAAGNSPELFRETPAFLSTMPAGRRDRMLAGTAIATSLAIFLAAAPLARTALAPVAAFIPIYESALVICDLITAVLLFGQFCILRVRGLWALAGGYLFACLMTVAHALSFPGLFAPGGLFDAGTQGTAWIYAFWHGGFSLCAIAYARLKTDARPIPLTGGRVRAAVLAAVSASLVLACALTLLAASARDILPAVMQDNAISPGGYAVFGLAWLLNLLALFVLWRRAPHSALDLWLMVVLCALVFDIALSALLNGGRFDLGFYAGRIFGLLAATFVLSVLLLENGRLYVRLVATHAREREKAIALKRLSDQVSASNRGLSEYNRKLASMNGELTSQRDEINRTNEKLAEASRAKSDFLANMSHEFRTPLNSIIGFSEILQDALYGPLNPKQAEYVARVLKTSRHLLRLINDILDLSKVEAGKMTLEIASLHINEVIDEVILLQSEAAAKHGIALTADTQATFGLAVEADERKLKQILFNLISNAVKFTPEGGAVTVSTSAPTPGPKAMLTVTVSDTGKGIAEEDLKKLFKEFSQLESPYTKKHEGTGLGLALTRKLVALHGGIIDVASRPGQGSRFFFSLPLIQTRQGVVE